MQAQASARVAKEIPWSWTAERVNRLVTMAMDGDKPAAEIARMLTVGGGKVTRNAVIGKLHRLGIGLPGRNSPDRTTKPKDVERRPAGALLPATSHVGAPGLFEVPGTAVAVSLPLSRADRAHLLSAVASYDGHHARVAAWIEEADDAPFDEDDAAWAPPERAPRPAAPAQTIPYWTGNDPKTLLDLGRCDCRYITHRSERTQATFYCGDQASSGEPFCTWHGQACTSP